jgi:hypothetical protein
MKILNKDKNTLHIYKVINDLNDFTNSNFPTVTMEISEEATIEDHIYAFERFLQSIGFVLPENAHLDFVENDIESDRDEEIFIKEPSNHKKNGKN